MSNPHSYTHGKMKIVIQRVSEARVKVDGSITGEISRGLALLVGIHHSDTEAEVEWAADKVAKMRIFQDADGKMNESVTDIDGGLLVISQFTLYGNARKGNRPSFVEAARPEQAESLYNHMVKYLRRTTGLDIQTGIFGAMMDVELINNGPVTIILEK